MKHWVYEEKNTRKEKHAEKEKIKKKVKIIETRIHKDKKQNT